MPYLDKALRRQFANTINQARLLAERGAAEAIARLGVQEDAAPPYLSDEQKTLRRTLRAHARSLGDPWEDGKLRGTARLVEATAYEHWHRMLFGRFLVERGLLVHPEIGVAIAREELAELAAEDSLPDEWALVERIAAPALPAVFKLDDPVLRLAFAPEHAKGLRDLVAELPLAIFTADDSLGWTYQFWRAAEKERVNKAGGKIGAAELPAVTQLFTEPYMVQFLLHNTLGAWWAGKVLTNNPTLAEHAPDEAALQAACALPGLDWTFLRFVKDDGGEWRPAAGTFPKWPKSAAQIAVCDPCCGSGHFLTAAFRVLVALRMEEERLDVCTAACVVLEDNLNGLEINGRCVQIAAFNVALSAWTIAGPSTSLPTPNIAWIGAPPPLSRAEMTALSPANPLLPDAMGALHDQFVSAPILGSLLRIGATDLFNDALRGATPLILEQVGRLEPEQTQGVIAAEGLLAAAKILMGSYHLLLTNVPFLLRRKHAPELSNFIGRETPEAKADLATAMLQRMREMAAQGGVVASITPQNWLFLGAYKALREDLLRKAKFLLISILGERAFESDAAAGAFAATVALSNDEPDASATFCRLDASSAPDSIRKSEHLRSGNAEMVSQQNQLRNPDARIGFALETQLPRLAQYALSPNGMHGADTPRFRHMFWEHQLIGTRWVPFQNTVTTTSDFGGREHVFDWLDDGSQHHENPSAYIKGGAAWGKEGVCVSLMRDLHVTRYTGEKFDISCSPIVPSNPNHLAAIWAFCSSDQFNKEVRKIDRALKVTNATLVKVPFDLAFWQQVAAERYPNGLPEPESDDPTQWLFHGHPRHSEDGTELHVALARFAGYRWPAETDSRMRLSQRSRALVKDAAGLPQGSRRGLLPLHEHGTERGLADRLRTYLGVAFNEALTPAREAEMIRAADRRFGEDASAPATLEAWLRDRAFRQHCKLFRDRPFLWHVWDGLPDGFSAFLYYHKLDYAALERLIYSLLGDWLQRVRGEGDARREEHALRLQQRLVLILRGEAPYDIFVRWKPIARQPVGWNPDLDDGVRLNIRPLIEGSVLRVQPRGVAWNKDRGLDAPSAPWFHLGPEYGEMEGARINAHHLSLAEKQAARAQAAE